MVTVRASLGELWLQLQPRLHQEPSQTDVSRSAPEPELLKTRSLERFCLHRAKKMWLRLAPTAPPHDLPALPPGGHEELATTVGGRAAAAARGGAGQEAERRQRPEARRGGVEVQEHREEVADHGSTPCAAHCLEIPHCLHA
jgi:hypothetical protein